MFQLKHKICEEIVGGGDDLPGRARPDILDSIMNFTDAKHAKQFSMAIQLLEHEIDVQRTLKTQIKAPADLGFLKKIVWNRIQGSAQRQKIDNEIKSLDESIYSLQWGLETLGHHSTVDAATAHYNQLADKEHAIADQWNYGCNVQQAHVRAGNRYRRQAIELLEVYVHGYKQFNKYYTIASDRWLSQYDHLK
jgi:hypothetical protein